MRLILLLIVGVLVWHHWTTFKEPAPTYGECITKARKGATVRERESILRHCIFVEMD